MWVSSISPPNLNLIDRLKAEIYYIGQESLMETQTHTQTEFDNLHIWVKGRVIVMNLGRLLSF